MLTANLFLDAKEEVYAEDYDNSEEGSKKIGETKITFELANCPNRGNPYHECVGG